MRVRALDCERGSPSASALMGGAKRSRRRLSRRSGSMLWCSSHGSAGSRCRRAPEPLPGDGERGMTARGWRTWHEVRRRVPRRRARAGAGGADPRDRRAGAPLQGDGGLRRAHPLDLQVRDRRPAAGQRRARPWARLPGLRYPDGPRRRRYRARASRGCDLHLLRRHAARAGLRADAARREGRREPTCAWSTRRSTRCESPRRTPSARLCSSRSVSRRPHLLLR